MWVLAVEESRMLAKLVKSKYLSFDSKRARSCSLETKIWGQRMIAWRTQ